MFLQGTQQIVFWNKLSKFEKKLLSQGKDLTLDKAIHIGQTYEMSGSQMKWMVPYPP